MTAKLVNLTVFRKKKSNERVFEALERFYQEVLIRLEDQHQNINPNEFEEFMAQVLGDHLVDGLKTGQQMEQLNQNYRRFDERLRMCLQTKLKTLSHFEKVQKKR